jgi:hypothetical protein
MLGSRDRFLLKEEERRRALGSVALFLAGLGVFVLLVAFVVFRLNESGPPPPELLRLLAAGGVVVALLLGAGLRVRLAPRNFVSVDAASGTVTIARGRKRRELPLAEIGPLRHALEERRVKSGKSWTTVVFHVARSEPHPEIRIFESEDELETRRALESRAKAWRLPYVQPTGQSRAPEELDVPVFERLGADVAVTKALPQKEGSSLAVTWKDDGHEISTSYRPPVDRTRLLLTLLVPPVLVGWILRELLLDAFRAAMPTPLRLVGAAVVVLAFVPGLWLAAKSWRRSSRPPVIRVSAEGVRFRRTTLPLRSIEEVERVPGGVARLVSDERIVEIDADFCDPSEREWLHHELRRLVVEAGQRAPLP